ncbi:MAG: hypothetical protein IT360_20295 [Gemmatimonadaceae bacterium]|nr:hypothetical protein [Gemmatimonadaceae bacterium]
MSPIATPIDAMYLDARSTVAMNSLDLVHAGTDADLTPAMIALHQLA